MTASEFKAWLAGYMLDRANPDPHVIAKKAAEISQAVFAPSYPMPTPLRNSPPYLSAPFTVSCGQSNTVASAATCN